MPTIRSIVADALYETPAVPPTEAGGDERLGFRIAAGVLVFLGWGLGVVANLIVHWLAPSNGLTLGPLRVFPTLGPFAWALAGFGLFTGSLGLALLWLADRSPPGRLVLPGYPY